MMFRFFIVYNTHFLYRTHSLNHIHTHTLSLSLTHTQCIHVPYTSLTMHLSHSNTERDSATLYRMIFEVLGTLVGIGVYTAYFSGFVRG